MVVAVDIDAHNDDPFKGLAVTTSGFARIGATKSGPGLPRLFMREYGYLSAALGDNLTHTLQGFIDA